MILRNRYHWLRLGVPLVGMAVVLVVFVISTVMQFPKEILALLAIAWWLVWPANGWRLT